VIVESDENKCAKKIRWKNRASGVYTWTHDAEADYTNDCPYEENGTDLFDDGYGVYRK